jgi:thiol:disulfide interchange protein DsbA
MSSNHQPKSLDLNRRHFSLGAAALGASASGLLMAAGSAQAQQLAVPVEGKDFVKLSTPVAVPTGGKIDVVEFFWYGCPHCYSFEPSLETWLKKLPSDVSFRRVHVAFSPMHETHAKFYFALEQLGVTETMNKKVFAAFHVQRMRFDKEADIVSFVTQQGIDGAKFTEAFRSFGVATKVRQAKQLVDGYKIDGVPSIGVHGRWYTAPSLAGGPIPALAVTDYLIGRARKV